MTNNNVLIINGRRYDATTGELLGSSDQPTNRTRTTDGFSISKKSKNTAAKKQTVDEKISKSSNITQQSSRRVGHAHDIILSKAIHSVSTTKPLMRRGVKKPSKTSTQFKQPQTPVPSQQVGSEIKTHQSPARAQRAEMIHQSSQIKHFSKHPSSEPKQKGVSTVPQPPVVYSSKITDAVTTQTDKLQNIIDRGIQKATSHDQESAVKEKRKHKPKKSKLRIFNTIVGILAVVLIIGFIIHKSIPDIDVRIASAQSGVHAEIPGYIPTGFKFDGPIKYGQGTVTVIFTSGDKSLRVTQQNSNWDSVGLRDSYVSTIDPHYTVVEAGGRIVYLYGQADATWVNAGIWYQITDNANLSTASLLRIVTSL
jgi:hypothetical protein